MVWYPYIITYNSHKVETTQMPTDPGKGEGEGELVFSGGRVTFWEDEGSSEDGWWQFYTTM